MAYTLTGKSGKVVRFEPMSSGIVDKESESYSSSVTSNPVENGADITDHVNNSAGTLSISGTVIGGDSAINALKKMRDSRDIITYKGKTKMSNLVFTSLKFDRSYKVKNGATFSATLKQIQLASKKKVKSKTMSSQDDGKSKKKKTKKTKKKGTKTVSSQSVSKNSAKKKKKAYKGSKNQSPATRKTGAYDGLSKK